MKRLLAHSAVVTTPGGLAVQGDQVGGLRPPRADPGHKTGREQIGVDAVHERAQPIGAGDAEVERAEAAQEREVGLAPVHDVVVVVVCGDRAKIGKSTRLNSSHANISYAVFCLKKKNPQYD